MNYDAYCAFGNSQLLRFHNLRQVALLPQHKHLEPVEHLVFAGWLASRS